MNEFRPGSEAEYRERESRKLLLEVVEPPPSPGRPAIGVLGYIILLVVAAFFLFAVLVLLG